MLSGRPALGSWSAYSLCSLIQGSRQWGLWEQLGLWEQWGSGGPAPRLRLDLYRTSYCTADRTAATAPMTRGLASTPRPAHASHPSPFRSGALRRHTPPFRLYATADQAVWHNRSGGPPQMDRVCCAAG